MNDTQELLKEFLESISGPVIVEGMKDRKALETLGVENIVQLHSGSSILEVVESLKDCDRAIILTDLDQSGKILRKKIIGYFALYGIQEDKRPREILAQMRVQHVEALGNLI